MSRHVGAVELGNPKHHPWRGVRSGLASITRIARYERCNGCTHNIIVGCATQPQVVKQVTGDLGRIGCGPGINDAAWVEKQAHYKNRVAAANDAYVVHRALPWISSTARLAVARNHGRPVCSSGTGLAPGQAAPRWHGGLGTTRLAPGVAHELTPRRPAWPFGDAELGGLLRRQHTVRIAVTIRKTSPLERVQLGHACKWSN